MTYTRLKSGCLYFIFKRVAFWEKILHDGEAKAKSEHGIKLMTVEIVFTKQKIRLWLLSRQLSHLFVQHIIHLMRKLQEFADEKQKVKYGVYIEINN